MKILITGGAGFLGSHLAKRLIDLNHDVICIDNLFTGRIKNIEELLNNRKFRFVQQDVQDKLNLDVEGIFNFACPASPLHYQKDPVRTMKTNVMGAINVLELAKSKNARVLQASTSEVYGDPEVSPQTESYWGNVNPIGIRSCYDEGKRAAETLFSDFHRQYSTDIRIARIFNTYGPNMSMDDGRVMSNLICQALSNEPLTVYGTGSQSRSFCFVSDLIEGLIALFFKESIHTPVNLGNPNPISMLELARTVKEAVSSKSEIVFEELPSDDPQVREPNISLANSELNWFPKIDLLTGLDKTIRYFKNEVKER